MTNVPDITIQNLTAEATFTYSFETETNNEIYRAMHPNGQLFAEGTDNNGILPPLESSTITLSDVMGDTRFGLRAVA